MIDITPERYEKLMSEELELTTEEIASGWHFCPEWDFLLTKPSEEEPRKCLCGFSIDKEGIE